LELFVLVCRAVQHAHQKGIIHRDLKPSNVLVAIVDGAAVPKIIDFGVAKATGGSLTGRTQFTGFHQLVGTPLYMSPEQAELSRVDVDTRSDIYSRNVPQSHSLPMGHPWHRRMREATSRSGTPRPAVARARSTAIMTGSSPWHFRPMAMPWPPPAQAGSSGSGTC
jgi:serine/threonine protein kinase